MVQGLLECDKDSSPSVQNDRVGAIGRKANWRERNRCSGADRRPAFRPRPRRREAKPNCRERKKARKSRATFAGIGFLLAQFRERKSLQLLLELLGVLIACPCKGADRRPAFRPRPRRCEAKPNCRERKKARKSRATFAGIGFLLAQFRERKSRATFAGIAWCADRTAVQRRRPAPGLSTAPAQA